MNSIINSIGDPAIKQAVKKEFEQILGNMAEDKNQLKNSLGTSPLNSTTLGEMIKTNEAGETMMYQPLMRNSMFGSDASIAKMGVNDLGKQMENAGFRDKLSSMMTSTFSGITAPNFTIEFQTNRQAISKPKAPAPVAPKPKPAAQQEAPAPVLDAKQEAAKELAERIAGILNSFDKKGNQAFKKKSASTLIADIENSFKDPASINLIRSIKERLAVKDIDVYITPDTQKGRAAYKSLNTLFNRREGTMDSSFIYGNSINDKIVFIVDPQRFQQADYAEKALRLLLHEITHDITSKSILRPTTENDLIFNARISEVFEQFLKANPGKSVEELLTKTS